MAESTSGDGSKSGKVNISHSDDESRGGVHPTDAETQPSSGKYSDSTLKDSGSREGKKEKVSELSTVESSIIQGEGVWLLKTLGDKTYTLPFEFSTKPEIKCSKGYECINHEGVVYQLRQSFPGSLYIHLVNMKADNFVKLNEYTVGEGNIKSTRNRHSSTTEEGCKGNPNDEVEDKSGIGASIFTGGNTVRKFKEERELAPDLNLSQVQIGDHKQKLMNTNSGENTTEKSNIIDVEVKTDTNKKKKNNISLGPPAETRETPERETSIEDSHQFNEGETDKNLGAAQDGDCDNLPASKPGDICDGNASEKQTGSKSEDACILDSVQKLETDMSDQFKRSLDIEKNGRNEQKKANISSVDRGKGKVMCKEKLSQNVSLTANENKTNQQLEENKSDGEINREVTEDEFNEEKPKGLSEQAVAESREFENVDSILETQTSRTNLNDNQQETNQICGKMNPDKSLGNTEKGAKEGLSYEDKETSDDGGSGSKVTSVMEDQSVRGRENTLHERTGQESPGRIQKNISMISAPADMEMTTTASARKRQTSSTHPAQTPRQEWRYDDGNGYSLKLLVEYIKKTKTGNAIEDDFCKHEIPCCMTFFLMWNFYTETDCGKKMLDDIISEHNCQVLSSSIKLFKVSGKPFQDDSEVKDLVDHVLDSIYICARESLSIESIGVDPRKKEDIQEKIKLRKELDCAWIKFVGEDKPVNVYIVCHKDHQQLVMQMITEVITDATKSYNSHNEVVAADFMWQRVMTEFGYLNELDSKFPQIEIRLDEELNAFQLIGPRDETKAAVGYLEDLQKTARTEVHVKVFSPDCQFEIFTYPEMHDYIDSNVGKPAVIWIPNSHSKEIHIFSKDPETVKGIDKPIKGCVHEKLYLFLKDNLRLHPEKVKLIEELKKKHKGKIVINSSASTPGLLVTTADDIFKGVDTAVYEIISSEIGEAHLETCVPEKLDKRTEKPGCKPELGVTSADMEKKGFPLEMITASDKIVSKSVEVTNKVLFKKLVDKDMVELIQMAKDHNVCLEISESQGNRVGFILKGPEGKVQRIYECINKKIQAEEQQTPLQQDNSGMAGATMKVDKNMTPSLKVAEKSGSNKMSGENDESGLQQIVWTYPNKKKVILRRGTTCDDCVLISVSDDQASPSMNDDWRVLVPLWKEGKDHEKEKLREEIKRILMKVSTDVKWSVGISINPVRGWGFLPYLKCFLYQIDQFHSDKTGGCLVECLILFTEDGDFYKTAFDIMQKYFKDKASMFSIEPQELKNIVTSPKDEKATTSAAIAMTSQSSSTQTTQPVTASTSETSTTLFPTTVALVSATSSLMTSTSQTTTLTPSSNMPQITSTSMPSTLSSTTLIPTESVAGSNGTTLSTQQTPTNTADTSTSGSVFKRIRVKVKKGQLHEAQTQVLVITVDKSLDLTKGVISSSLLDKAGKGIQSELKQYQGKFVFGQVLKTGVGSLPKPCMAIFHGVLYVYKEHSDCLKLFQDFLAGCLEDANKKYRSIAFPPIGTGKLRYPKDLVASLMFQSVTKFEQDYPTSNLEEVIFMIYEKDQETLKVFEDMYWRCTETTVANQLVAVPPVSGVSKMLKYGQVQVQAKLGDFQNENQNCLLVLWEKQCLYNITDKNSILHSAGNTVIQKWKEHRKSRQFYNDAVLVTPGGNLRYTKIIHVGCDINNIKNAAKAGLMKADSEKMKTVVVPITRDDSLQRNAKTLCEEILKAANELGTKFKFVKSVAFIIQGQHNFPFFNEVFEQESRMYGESSRSSRANVPPINPGKSVKSSSGLSEPIEQQISPDERRPDLNIVQKFDTENSRANFPPINPGKSVKSSSGLSELNGQQISPDERRPDLNIMQTLVIGPESSWAGHNIPLVQTSKERCCIIVSGDIKSREDLEKRFSSYNHDSNKLKYVVYPYKNQSALIIFDKELDIKTLDLGTDSLKVESLPPKVLQDLEFILSNSIVERADRKGDKEMMFKNLKQTSGIEIICKGKQVYLVAVTAHQLDIARHCLETFCEERLNIKINKVSKSLTKGSLDEESYNNFDVLNKVSEVEFKALEIMKNDFQKIKAKFFWNDDSIFICGPPEDKVVNLKELKSCLGSLRNKQVEIPLDEKEKNVVLEVVEEVQSEDTICIFDQKNSQVVLFSDKQDDIRKFKHKLKLRTGKVKESGRDRRRFVENTTTLETSKGEFSSSFRSTENRQEFSWSKDASDVEVFYTKENIKISVYKANILNLPVDCIVNAANDRLQHGGGVAKVIAEAAGPELVEEGDAIIKKLCRIPVGVQVTTVAGRLPYQCVIHTVGPCWSDYQPHTLQKVAECEKDLYAAIYGCFIEAEKKGLSTIALPAVSSGIYAVPQDMCAVQYAKAVLDYSRDSTQGPALTEIHFIDKLPHLVKLIQDTFRTMILNGKVPNYNIQNYVALSSGYQRQQLEDMRNMGQKKGANAAINSQYETTKSKELTPSYYESTENHKKHFIFQVSAKPVVHIYEGNILKLTNIDAVVCLDDSKGTRKGIIASELGKMPKYKQQKEKSFKSLKPGLGDVVITYGEENPFHVIVHVVIENNTHQNPEMKSTVQQCIDNILRKTNEWVKVKTIAMPLFGVRYGLLSEKSWADLFLERFVAFCHEVQNPNLMEVHIILYNSSSSVYTTLKKVFCDFADQAKKRQPREMLTPPRPPPPKFCRMASDDSQEPFLNRGNGSKNEENEENECCTICMCPKTDPKFLSCGHSFCSECYNQMLEHKPVCAVCGTIVGTITGDQPENGRMSIRTSLLDLAGYKGCGSIVITYDFPSGKQGPNHPSPGVWYGHMTRTAYLPNTPEGTKVCKMLKLAFDRRLVFTISQSRTTGKEGLTWNDIHHKTNPNPGAQFGFPDPEYFSRVKDELSAKGITEDDI